MSLYRKVSVAIWEGDFAAKAAGDGELWTVCHYLMTNRHNQFGIGLYRLPLVFIADATGFALETCRRCVSDASEMGFARYDDARKTVFVVEQARHEWGESPNVKRNDVAGMIKGLPELFFDLRKSFLVKDFCDRYEDSWRDVFNALETHPRRVADALETRPAGARAQNRTQETGDRKQDQEVLCSDPVPSDGSEPAREVAFWFPVVKGTKPWPADCRENGTGREAPVYEAQVAEREADWKGMEIRSHIQACLRWNKDHGSQRKTPTGLSKHIGSWLETANRRGELKAKPKPRGFDPKTMVLPPMYEEGK